jgi:predicted rRNA methylase YqxC with S4 and FtsJ domains
MNERFPCNRPEENYALIVCGNVLVNNVKMRNSSEKIDPASEIIITEKKYVSREVLSSSMLLGTGNKCCRKGFS